MHCLAQVGYLALNNRDLEDLAQATTLTTHARSTSDLALLADAPRDHW